MPATLLHRNEQNESYFDFDFHHFQHAGATNKLELERMKEVLLRVIDTELTEKQRVCVTEYIMNGKRQREIAKQLGLSSSTVSRHITAGKRKLQKAAQRFMQ